MSLKKYDNGFKKNVNAFYLFLIFDILGFSVYKLL